MVHVSSKGWKHCFNQNWYDLYLDRVVQRRCLYLGASLQSTITRIFKGEQKQTEKKLNTKRSQQPKTLFAEKKSFSMCDGILRQNCCEAKRKNPTIYSMWWCCSTFVETLQNLHLLSTSGTMSITRILQKNTDNLEEKSWEVVYLVYIKYMRDVHAWNRAHFVGASDEMTREYEYFSVILPKE